MKASILFLFLLCSAALASAQPQLALNPGCPANASFCRGTITPVPNSSAVPVVLGSNNGVLYAYVLADTNQSCPNSGGPLNAGPTLCFYSSTSFNPEYWYFKGQRAQNTDAYGHQGIPFEIVFPSGSCSNYKYIYTGSNQILRATASLADWNFYDVGSGNLGSLPQDAIMRPNSLAAAKLGTTTRLFYGKYSDHTAVNNAFIEYSDDCGNSWSSPITFYCLEVHSITPDPGNNFNVYVMIDCENSPSATAAGLWRATDGGTYQSSFAHLTPYYSSPDNEVALGIDLVFPAGMNKIFMETDGCAGAANPGCTGPNRPTGSGPLLSHDEIAGHSFQIAAPWPDDFWGGDAYSIGLTSEQNIFLATDTEINNREGLWYFAPPNYDSAILLEDLAPLLGSYQGSPNGFVFVTTAVPHGLTQGDAITVCIPGQPALNARNVVPTITGPTTLNYFDDGTDTCPTQPPATAAFLRKSFGFGGRTIEVTDPTTNMSYLYSGIERMPKPRTNAELATMVQILYENLLQ